MRERLASSALPAPVRGRESLEHRPIGTNGYVSTWGAPASACPPPQGC